MSTKVIGIMSGFTGLVEEIPFNDKCDFPLETEVIFKDSEGKEEYGVVKYINRDCLDADRVLFTSRILRRATANDLQKVENYFSQSDHALKACKDLASLHGVEMYPFRSGFSFDGSRVHFMFISDDRVDFRDLVKDLAKQLQKKIYLRQIGPRDKSKVIGGYGNCGREICCSSWLDKLESINMEMVREQGLEGKGSSKLSGVCGKLLCCLKYEVFAYKDLRQGLPSIGSFVTLKKTSSPSGSKKDVKVVGLDVLNQKIKILSPDNDYLVVGVSDIEEIKGN